MLDASATWARFMDSIRPERGMFFRCLKRPLFCWRRRATLCTVRACMPFWMRVSGSVPSRSSRRISSTLDQGSPRSSRSDCFGFIQRDDCLSISSSGSPMNFAKLISSLLYMSPKG